MIYQMFNAQRTIYQVLPNFRICCKKLGGLKITSFRACVRSFCSVQEGLDRAIFPYISIGKVRLSGVEASNHFCSHSKIL